MKKVLFSLLSVLTVFTLTGCGKENVSLDLTKISSELDALTTNDIDIHGIDIESMEVFSELDYVYDFDFEDVLGLDPELVSEYSVNYNYKEKEILAIFKPVDGKTNDVKESLESFMEELDAELQEVNGLLIYVASSNNELVFKTVKETKTPVFGMMMEVTKDQVKDVFNIEESDVEEFLMKMPMMMTQSNTYIIVKPAEGKEEFVENAINDYMSRLESQWETYLPDQYELVKNRKVEKIGDYLVYIVSNNNDLVFNTISNNKVTE